MLRELVILRRNHIYGFVMILFPLLVIFFFTSLMDDGLPTSMPVGVVDLDNTSTTRALERRLDGFQMSHVVAHYPSVAEAREVRYTASSISPRELPMICWPVASPRCRITIPIPRLWQEPFL